MRTFFFVFTLLYLLASCASYGEEHDSSKLLRSVAYTLEADAEQSLLKLQQVNVSLLNEQEYAYYTLLQARTRDRMGANIGALEESVQAAKEVVLSEHQPERAAFACFVAGRVYEGQMQQHKALYEYLQAEDWAKKNGCQLVDIVCSDISYNIALLYAKDQNYKGAKEYIARALDFIGSNHVNYTKELHALELKGIVLRRLDQIDSALICYSKALEIAVSYDDVVGKNRILHNEATLLYYAKDYSLVEERCREQLPQCIASSDTLHEGLLYLTLAEVYQKTSKVDSALLFANKAKSLLADAEPRIAAPLYETLAAVESKKGNLSKAASYKQQLEKLQVEQDVSRKQQEMEVAIATERSIQQGETAKQVLQVAESNRSSYKQLLIFVRLSLGVAVLALVSFGVAVYLKRRKRLQNDRELCREEMLLFLSQQRNIRMLTADLEQVGHCEQRRSMEETLENLQIVLKMSPQLDRTFGRMYYDLREIYPDLTTDELYMFWLAKTRTLQVSEMREYMGYSPEEFNRVWQSVVAKVSDRGNSFRAGWVTVKNIMKDDKDIPLSK